MGGIEDYANVALDVEMRSGGFPDPVVISLRAMRNSFIYNLCCVAALTWVVYDTILCFDREYNLVWRRWKEPKGRHSRQLYVFIRYFSLVNLILTVSVNTTHNISFEACKGFHHVTVVTMSLIVNTPDLLILLRITSVYGWSTLSVLLALFVFSVNTIMGLVLGMLAVESLGPPNHLSLSLPGCYMGSAIKHPWCTLASWIPSIIGHCIYFILIVYTLLHVMTLLDENGRISVDSWSQLRRLVPTMMLFIKHGLWYFFIGILGKIIGAVSMIYGRLRLVGALWLLSLYPILLTRIYLHMVASIYDRKPIQHHLEARVWVPVNGEARDQEEVHIRFSYNPQSMPNEQPEPITPVSTAIHGNLESEIDLETVHRRRSSSRRNATWRRYSGLFVL